MAKKTHVKVRLVPEDKPNSAFFYYVKKPAGGEKAKIKLKAKKYNPVTKNMKFLLKKNFHLIVNNYFFFKISSFIIYISPNHIFPYTVSYFWINI